MIKCVAQAFQRGLRSKCLQSVAKNINGGTLLFRNPKTGATVVKTYNNLGINTAFYKAGERTNKIVKDCKTLGIFEQKAHFIPSIYTPDKIVKQEFFSGKTYVAQKNLLTEIVNGQKKIAEPMSMQSFVERTFWA